MPDKSDTPEAKIIRVMIVDDHRRVHQALAEMFDFIDDVTLVAQANNGAEAVALCEQHEIDLILMDIVMPVMDGLEATKAILGKHPEMKILALSSFKDHETVHKMLHEGAIGYILKESSVDDLAHTIRVAYEGQRILSPEVMQSLLETPPPTSVDFDLSPREIEVLKSLAEGNTNNEIAHHLSISVSTVKFHIANIITKMGVSSRAEALVLATRHNFI
jgi:NarL family two-component system response regulator LiaR